MNREVRLLERTATGWRVSAPVDLEAGDGREVSAESNPARPRLRVYDESPAAATPGRGQSVWGRLESSLAVFLRGGGGGDS